jgi:hypothetical protein
VQHSLLLVDGTAQTPLVRFAVDQFYNNWCSQSTTNAQQIHNNPQQIEQTEFYLEASSSDR